MSIQDIICDEYINRLIEESKEWYGYLPKGFVSTRLKSFFEDLNKLLETKI